MPSGVYKRVKQLILPRVEDSDRYTIDGKTGCWNYKMSLTITGGYGQYSLYLGKRKYKNISAHRYFYEKKYGQVPEGKQLDHLCRNRACVNPDHLEPVTCAENVRRGAIAKLSLTKVAEIKSKYNMGTKQYQLADMYKVNQSQISRALHGLRWA